MILKYGKEQEKTFNTNCKVINLLSAIRLCATTLLPTSADLECIDVAEETTGVLQFLSSSINECANTVLTSPNSTYILIKVQSKAIANYLV